jgi:aerobic C4-dicarboxylate transport protein
MVVFATTSSETVLPRMMAKLEDAGCEESVVGLAIPTGYSFNLDGTCLYLATAAVFLAQATNTTMIIEHQIGLLAVLLLASKGAAGVAGAASIDVGRLDANQSDRQWSSYDCHCQMGKGARRA